MNPFCFKPIDLDRDAGLCVKFRADSFACSFKTDRVFYERYGSNGDGYLELLKSNHQTEAFHLWENSQIIGQVEFGIRDQHSRLGHVYLYYLIPEKRRMGLGRYLDEFATESLKARGAVKATLTVSPINQHAITYYEKQGWRNLGRNADEARNSTSGLSVYYMEKTLV